MSLTTPQNKHQLHQWNQRQYWFRLCNCLQWTTWHQAWLQISRHPQWILCHETRPQHELRLLHNCQTAWPIGFFIYIFPLVFLVKICFDCLLSVLEGLEAWENRFLHGEIPLELVNCVIWLVIRTNGFRIGRLAELVSPRGNLVTTVLG